MLIALIVSQVGSPLAHSERTEACPVCWSRKRPITADTLLRRSSGRSTGCASVSYCSGDADLLWPSPCIRSFDRTADIRHDPIRNNRKTQRALRRVSRCRGLVRRFGLICGPLPLRALSALVDAAPAACINSTGKRRIVVMSGGTRPSAGSCLDSQHATRHKDHRASIWFSRNAKPGSVHGHLDNVVECLRFRAEALCVHLDEVEYVGGKQFRPPGTRRIVP